jgi:hypothetical protein
VENDARELLEPFDGHVTMTRNGTELSRLSERLVTTFVRYGAAVARVKHEMTDYDLETLYAGVRRVCKKTAYRDGVAVHKQNGKIILIRKKGRQQ